MNYPNNAGNNRYNPAIHRRRSIRLRNYDYSRPGHYFITFCIHDRWLPLFGHIIDGQMELNECGTIAHEWIVKIAPRFPGATVDSWVVMPNHVHMIVSIAPSGVVVGAIHELPLPQHPAIVTPTQQHHELPLPQHPAIVTPTQQHHELPLQQQRRLMIIPKIVGYYRMNTAKRINALHARTGKPVWQRNYWEHVIRNQREFYRIRQYILNNPAKWEIDRLNGRDGSAVREEAASYADPVWMI